MACSDEYSVGRWCLWCSCFGCRVRGCSGDRECGRPRVRACCSPAARRAAAADRERAALAFTRACDARWPSPGP